MGRSATKKKLHSCIFVWISEQTVIIVVYIINGLVFITEVESVYSAVRPESLYNTGTFRP